MKRLLVVAALAFAAVALGADMKANTSTVYSQPIGGRTLNGTVVPLQASDAGVLAVSGPVGATLVVRAQAADGGAEFGVTGPGGATLVVRSQTPDGGTEQAVGGPGGATLVVRAQATDGGAEFGVTGPGGDPVVVSGTATVTQGTSRDGGYDWGVNVDNFPASYPVTGTFWQATQPVSGAVTVSGTTTVDQGVSRDGGYDWGVTVDNFPASQAVTGTFWQATQPVSGTFWQANQPVIARDGGDEFGVTGAGGGAVYVQGPDGGSYFNAVPCYLRTFAETATCTSTGPTNNGTFTVAAGSCVSFQPSAATYVGQWSATLADAGPSCLNTDGGTAICTEYSAKKEVFKQLGPLETSGSCVSYSGTSITSVKVSTY